MLKKIAIILAGVALYGCTNSSNNHNAADNDANAAKAQQVKKDNGPGDAKGNLYFSEPQQIDNSAVVMYQLDFADKDRTSGSGSFISKSDGRMAYWSIIFLNTETHQYH